MNVTIHSHKLNGEVIIPPSKSLSHRAIIAAGLAKGESVISNVMLSKDIIATIEAIKSIGASIIIKDNTLIINGSDVIRKQPFIDANESGSTIRFFIPICLVNPSEMEFRGKNNLVNRPLSLYYKLFDKFNIKYEKPDNAYLPLKTKGGLKAGIYEIDGNVSSQFITGLLYALPLLNGDSKIIITTLLESKGYIDLTLDILEKYGIKIINNDYREFIIKGNQIYKPYDYEVEKDYSQTAFFLIAGAMGANIKLKDMNKKSLQGDKKIIEDINTLGGNVLFDGNDLVSKDSLITGGNISFSQTPDLGPALAVLASIASGKSIFTDVKRLRIKECDRVSCMRIELNKLGANITEEEDKMIINGVARLKGGIVDSHNDHRVAMALAMASLKMDEDLTILNAECVSKSYPDFWETFKSLGGIISYE